MVGENKDVWLRFYGILVHIWNSEFFVSLAGSSGTFICIDENTAKGDVFDVARIMVKVHIPFKTPNFFSTKIDKKVFKLFVREDALYQIHYYSGILKSLSSGIASFDSEVGWCNDYFAIEDNLVTEFSGDSIEQFFVKDDLVEIDKKLEVEGSTKDGGEVHGGLYKGLKAGSILGAVIETSSVGNSLFDNLLSRFRNAIGSGKTGSEKIGVVHSSSGPLQFIARYQLGNSITTCIGKIGKISLWQLQLVLKMIKV